MSHALHVQAAGAGPARILIVAPSDALRNSLRFLFEEESYTATTAASLAEASLASDDYACTVLDHHALRDSSGAEITEFTNNHWPVVLLNNGTGPAAPAAFRTIAKPLLGPALSQAVREAIATAAHQDCR
jgi:DNA-binding NtrC family response regulator